MNFDRICAVAGCGRPATRWRVVGGMHGRAAHLCDRHPANQQRISDLRPAEAAR